MSEYNKLQSLYIPEASTGSRRQLDFPTGSTCCTSWRHRNSECSSPSRKPLIIYNSTVFHCLGARSDLLVKKQPKWESPYLISSHLTSNVKLSFIQCFVYWTELPCRTQMSCPGTQADYSATWLRAWLAQIVFSMLVTLQWAAHNVHCGRCVDCRARSDPGLSSTFVLPVVSHSHIYRHGCHLLSS